MKNKSVIYIVWNVYIFHYEQLIVAQKTAQQNNLPLAVVYGLGADFLPLKSDNNRLFQRLSSIESRLKRLNIPLMVLLGETSQSLFAVTYHVQPIVFTDDPTKLPPIMLSAASTKSTINQVQSDDWLLVAHPMQWSGTVLSVKQVWKLALSGSTCGPS